MVFLALVPPEDAPGVTDILMAQGKTPAQRKGLQTVPPDRRAGAGHLVQRGATAKRERARQEQREATV